MSLRSFILLLSVIQPETMRAENPTEQINAAIRTGWEHAQVRPAPNCSDSQFARRLYLDIAGRIPTTGELDTFLNDPSEERRDALIDRLLNSEEYVRHFASVFDTLLMGRTSEQQYATRRNHQWQSWLEVVFRDNRPWNTVVEEILLARPDSQDDRGVVWFLYERNNQHQQIAEAIAPAFFGIHIECAQCHDHMMAPEIEQAHYWGLVAFFNRGTNQKTPNGPRVAETAIGGFSDFANLEGSSSPNLLTFFQSPVVDETRPAAGEKQLDSNELYVPASLNQDPRVPLFSRREQFVQHVVKEHPLIARAFVNRIWALLMGRGIVHPFDEMDSTNEPSHPELLDWLSEDFRRSKYNIRRLVKAILQSYAYQLASHRPDGIEDPATFAWSLERPLTAEQLARSIETGLTGTQPSEEAGTLTKRLRQALPKVLPTDSVTTVRDALFLSNNPALHEYITECQQEDHLQPRLLALPAHFDKAELLFRTLYGRDPSAEEQRAVAGYLAAKPDELKERLQQVVWSMITSAEFHWNH